MQEGANAWSGLGNGRPHAVHMGSEQLAERGRAQA